MPGGSAFAETAFLAFAGAHFELTHRDETQAMQIHGRKCLLLLLLAGIGGCRTAGSSKSLTAHAPTPAESAMAATAGREAPAQGETSPDGEVQAVAWQTFESDSIVSPGVAFLAGPHPVEEYVSFALSQNPEIQMARQEVRRAAYRVPQAASLADPMLGVTWEPEPVQTAAGEQRFIVSASQRFPLGGKLSTAASAAEAEAQASRAKLAAVELRVVEEVRRAYYDLYYYDQAIEINLQMRELIAELAVTLEERLRAGGGSQHDVLQSQLEVTSIDNELVLLRQQREVARNQLARLMHVSPETPLETVALRPAAELPRDLERLYEAAVAMRPELHAQVYKLQADRARIDLARKAYIPDVTASLTWMDIEDEGISPVANGQDAWLVGVNMNIPIYRRRIEASIREAEAGATASARQYDVLRDRALSEVRDLIVAAESQRELMELLSDDIVPRADQTLQVALREYEVGGVDFLQLIDNWRGLLRYRLNQERVEVQLRQTMASLERAVGGYPASQVGLERLPIPSEVPESLPPRDAAPLPPPAPTGE